MIYLPFPYKLCYIDRGSMKNSRIDSIKNRLVNKSCKIITLFGMIAYIPSVYLSITVNLWTIVIINTLAFTYFIILSFSRKISIKLKKISLVIAPYLLGCILLVYTGPFGAGIIYLFSFSFCTSLFYAKKAVIISNIMLIITLLSFSLLNYLKILAWDLEFMNIIIITCNFILVSVLISVAISWLMTNLEKKINQQERLTQKIRKEVVEKNKLLYTKTILMQELQHRVKNNLQLISSLISMQIRRKKSDLSTLKSIQDQVFSIATVHNTLYINSDVERIELNELLRTIVRNLVSGFQEKSIEFQFNIETKFFISIGNGVLIALIINELITNAKKHAFKGRKKGIIALNIEERKNSLAIILSDNGLGIKQGPEFEKKMNGLKIVNALVKQMSAQMEIENNSGSIFTITIPEENKRSKSGVKNQAAHLNHVN